MAVQARYIDRPAAAPRIRAGGDARQRSDAPISWIHDRAPRLRVAGKARGWRAPIWALSQ